MILYKESTTEFLSKLEPPTQSRYAYRLLELDFPKVKETDKIRKIIADARADGDGELWNTFEVRFFHELNDIIGVLANGFFVNDIFMSETRYSVVFQIYVVPHTTLDEFYDYDTIGIVYETTEQTNPQVLSAEQPVYRAGDSVGQSI